MYPIAKAINSQKKEAYIGRSKTTISEPVPANRPLIATIVIGFLEDSFLGKLFSRPNRHRQEESTFRDPYEKEKILYESKDRTMLAIVISTIAVHSFFDICSLKNRKANTAVAAISKFSRSAAFAAEVCDRPVIRRSGR